ncbi:MAG: nucleotidyltransferase family protein [Pyrinomonadaceae bacterium]
MKRAEHELLFAIARRESDPDLRNLVARVSDWEYLLTTAMGHGLVALLQKHLFSLKDDLKKTEAPIPTSVLSRLKLQCVSNLSNVLHLLGKQLTVHQLLDQNAVPAAIFKGSVLSQIAYGDISLRQAGDIDVLISPKHFDRARKLLESLGYQMTPPLTDAQLASHLKSHCEIQFVRDDWLTVVDLHWALAPKSFVFKLDADEVLSRLQTVTIGGAEIKTLSTEDSILYQSMHGAKHLWRRIEWISALGETIRAAQVIDWDAVIKRAAEAHATRMLTLGLRLAERLSGTRVPAGLDHYRSMDRLAENILKTTFSVTGAADSTETNLYNLKIMDRKRDALASTLRALFVPTLTDWSALNLPPSLHSLYYAYRPLRLSKVYTASLWQRIYTASRWRRLSSKGAA